MISIKDIWDELHRHLPKGVVVDSFSCYPLPYKGYYEFYVQTKEGKRFRALATQVDFRSDFTEWQLPHQVSQSEVKHG